MTNAGSRCDVIQDFGQRTLRRLGTSEISFVFQPGRTMRFKSILVGAVIIVAILSTLMRHYQSSDVENSVAFIRRFFWYYRKQYIEYFYEKCSYRNSYDWFDSEKILKSIREESILHQDRALEQLEAALRSKDDIITIALTGPVGVGKSLVLNSLAANFPWPENVYAYAWNAYVRDDSDKFRMIRAILERLSDCDRNLLIVENLKASDYGVPNSVNKLAVQIANGQRRVIIFYVFNLNAMRDEYPLAEQSELFTKSLPVAHVINFKAFTKNELGDCVYREMTREKVILKPEDLNEIIETIDVTHSGCKKVKAKVLMYGIAK
uniref:AAA+ ATPase domain-containing protein n=1 Tax=Glossina brevipalpis TaxID=37001 RepID=A0A1A9WA08_9MUSC